MNDLNFMTMAQCLALKGKRTVSPNPMVGAVIVKGGKVMAQGFHHHPGGPHAEIVALQKIKRHLKGAKLYVTLEPCFHHGRTPPCVDAIIASGISEVIIGMKDPNPLTGGKSILKLRKAGIKVRTGILQDDLLKLNEAFVKWITFQMPFVVAKTAQTLDGKIATRTGESRWITASPTREYAHDLRNEFDAILVGVNTILKDNPKLNASQKQLKKIVVDSTLKISVKANIFRNTKPHNCLIATTSKADPGKVAKFLKKRVEVVICPSQKGKVDLKWLMGELARKDISKILIEGGGKLIGSALKEKLVDRMMIFVAPKILGDQQAINAIEGLPTVRLEQSVELREVTIHQIGQDCVIQGYVK